MTPLILSVFATFATGGPQVRFASIANHHGARFRHAVVAMDGDRSCRARLDRQLDVRFPEINLRKGDTRGNIGRIRRFLRAERPSVLVTSNWGSIEWALANLVPMVRHVHVEDGFGPEERDAQIPRRVWTRRLALRRVPVIVPSRTLQRIAQTSWRLPRVTYLPNGIDLGRFTPDAAPDRIPVVGTVAALRPEKNLTRLVHAVAGLPIRLLVVGDGPERPGLERLASELGVSARFVGAVTDPAPLYREMDIFALSSDTEQMPLSVLEAMAAGLPVAATDVGDVREMLAPANGKHVVPRDPAALARAIADSGRRRTGTPVDRSIQPAQGGGGLRPAGHVRPVGGSLRRLDEAQRRGPRVTRGPRNVQARRRSRPRPARPAPRTAMDSGSGELTGTSLTMNASVAGSPNTSP